MLYKPTILKGLLQIETEPIIDQRGIFARSFCKKELSALGVEFNLVQVNNSFNKKKHTLRGMHFQKAPREEKKIVRCSRGAVFDVAVDIRPDSSTYLAWYGTILTEDNFTSLLIPNGYAHGFLTLVDKTEVNYLMSEYYYPEYSAGYRWDDPEVNIKWPETNNLIMSPKDQHLPDFSS